MESIVNFRNVTKSFHAGDQHVAKPPALSEVNGHLREHEIVSLLGPSGCGKSTLLNLLAGFIFPTHGSVNVRGESVTGPHSSRLVVFQTPALFPWLNVLDNVTFGVKRNGSRKKSEYVAEAREALKVTGLSGFERYWPYELSGGMRQRVQIARALITSSNILLLDEPFGALDAQTRFEMQELLLELHGMYKPAVLFITHDVEEALFLSDRIYIMSANPGQVSEELDVPFVRPRTVECLAQDDFVQLKRHILTSLQEMRNRKPH